VTTTAAEAGTVDLAQANGSAPKRRGRPPGSKNKPKETATATPKQRGRPRKTTTARKTATRTRRAPAPVTPTPTATATAVPEYGAVFPWREAHAILIEDSGLVVMNSNGDSYGVTAPVIVDRRK
jgi:hypothetical protein